MTPDEHLDKIVAKCRDNIELARGLLHMRDSIAGWRSTIAAVERFKASKHLSEDVQEYAFLGLEEIRAAWPEELL